ncbi:MAG: hypothetical protein QXO54_03420 [Candidatus Methanomethylicaceae archaeon]
MVVYRKAGNDFRFLPHVVKAGRHIHVFPYFAVSEFTMKPVLHASALA